jgi:predicted nucleic acid-binding protein
LPRRREPEDGVCGTRDATGCLKRLTHINELAIQVDRPPSLQPFDATLLLARAHNLTSYDASYLELAVRVGLPLATLDTRMRDAAIAAGVQLFV